MPRHFISPPRKSNQTGFTLIEMLVVLIIVGMISGILFQALERAYRLQNRFGMELIDAQQGQMVADWYRQTVQGLYPDYAGGAHSFQGKEQEFSGLTSNPLSENYGAPTAIAWKIISHRKNDVIELVYIEGQKEMPIMSWRGSSARFVYFDEEQTPHDVWPPPLGLFPQIPKQIHLVVKSQIETINLIAAPRGPKLPPARPQDFTGGTP